MNLPELRSLELKLRRALTFALDAEHSCSSGTAHGTAIKDRLTGIVSQLSICLDDVKSLIRNQPPSSTGEPL